MPRLFVGLEIPEPVMGALAGLRGGLSGARWVEPENYHVTLRFVGDVDEDVADDLYARLADRRPRAPVEVIVDGLGAFGGDRPHAVLATVIATPALVDLQEETERLVRRAGLEPERRKFTPHVTLARLKRVPPQALADWIAVRAPFERLSFSADRLAVFSAKEGSGGGPYVVEAAYPLG